MEIEEKIKTVSDEINCLCDEHEISEERVLHIADLIKQRKQLEFVKNNEVWEQIKEPSFYTDEFEFHCVPEKFKVGFHYQENNYIDKIKMINNEFSVDLDYIYNNGNREFEGKELEEYNELCDKYYPQDNKFIIWCLKREYKNVIIFTFPSMAKGYYYEVFIVTNEPIEGNEEQITKLKEYCKNYCQGWYE